jgi:hypothetical protein
MWMTVLNVQKVKSNGYANACVVQSALPMGGR